jgi:outer membrane protein OmpA-like peptidoglycan-associated protein
MAKSFFLLARDLRSLLAASSAIALAAATPASAQLRSVDPSNSVLIDMGALEGIGPAPQSGAVVAPGTGAPAGNLMLPPPTPPQSRLLVPGARSSAGLAPPQAPQLRRPEPEPRREAQRTAPSRSAAQPKSAPTGSSGAPTQRVERRNETAQAPALPPVALPVGPGPTQLDAPASPAPTPAAPQPGASTAVPTPPPAVAPPPAAPQQQMTAAAPPPVPAPKSQPKATKSTAPTPPPAVEPPKPAEATPPPAAAAPPPAAQPAPPPNQQAAIPERAPTPPRAATPAAPESMEIRFAAGDANLAEDGKARLDQLTDSLKANEASRLQLLAYAGEESPSKARRLSLSRALAIRSYLIAKGIRSTRIDVRALGDQIPGGNPNRVDLKITDR